MSRFDQGAAGPSQRQLRVGELIRHELSAILTRGEVNDPDLDGVIVSVGEVRLSPDLKVATALVMPLGGRDKDKVIRSLVTGMPHPYDVAHDDVHLSGVLVEVDSTSGRAIRIERVWEKDSSTPSAYGSDE